MAALVVGTEPASGNFYRVQERVGGVTTWQALPRLGLQASPMPGTSGSSVATNSAVTSEGTANAATYPLLTQQLAVTVGSNGYVVGANPRGSVK